MRGLIDPPVGSGSGRPSANEAPTWSERHGFGSSVAEIETQMISPSSAYSHISPTSEALATPMSDSLKESTAEAVKRVAGRFGDKVRICVLGGTVFQNTASEELVQAVASCLDAGLNGRVVFITAGLPGVQKVFAKSCGDGSRVWTLVAPGQTNKYGIGGDLHAGLDLQHRKDIYAHIGDIYVTFEGGPAVSADARVAMARGAAVLPVMRTGGASAGTFGFPAEALQRPSYISDTVWSLLAQKEAPIEETADAVHTIIAGMMAARGGSARPPSHRVSTGVDTATRWALMLAAQQSDSSGTNNVSDDELMKVLARRRFEVEAQAPIFIADPPDAEAGGEGQSTEPLGLASAEVRVAQEKIPGLGDGFQSTMPSAPDQNQEANGPSWKSLSLSSQAAQSATSIYQDAIGSAGIIAATLLADGGNDVQDERWRSLLQSADDAVAFANTPLHSADDAVASSPKGVGARKLDDRLSIEPGAEDSASQQFRMLVSSGVEAPEVVGIRDATESPQAQGNHQVDELVGVPPSAEALPSWLLHSRFSPTSLAHSTTEFGAAAGSSRGEAVSDEKLRVLGATFSEQGEAGPAMEPVHSNKDVARRLADHLLGGASVLQEAQSALPSAGVEQLGWQPCVGASSAAAVPDPPDRVPTPGSDSCSDGSPVKNPRAESFNITRRRARGRRKTKGICIESTPVESEEADIPSSSGSSSPEPGSPLELITDTWGPPCSTSGIASEAMIDGVQIHGDGVFADADPKELAPESQPELLTNSGALFGSSRFARTSPDSLALAQHTVQAEFRAGDSPSERFSNSRTLVSPSWVAATNTESPQDDRLSSGIRARLSPPWVAGTMPDSPQERPRGGSGARLSLAASVVGTMKAGLRTDDSPQDHASNGSRARLSPTWDAGAMPDSPQGRPSAGRGARLAPATSALGMMQAGLRTDDSLEERVSNSSRARLSPTWGAGAVPDSPEERASDGSGACLSPAASALSAMQAGLLTDDSPQHRISNGSRARLSPTWAADAEPDSPQERASHGTGSHLASAYSTTQAGLRTDDSPQEKVSNGSKIRRSPTWAAGAMPDSPQDHVRYGSGAGSRTDALQASELMQELPFESATGDSMAGLGTFLNGAFEAPTAHVGSQAVEHAIRNIEHFASSQGDSGVLIDVLQLRLTVLKAKDGLTYAEQERHQVWQTAVNALQEEASRLNAAEAANGSRGYMLAALQRRLQALELEASRLNAAEADDGSRGYMLAAFQRRLQALELEVLKVQGGRMRSWWSSTPSRNGYGAVEDAKVQDDQGMPLGSREVFIKNMSLVLRNTQPAGAKGNADGAKDWVGRPPLAKPTKDTQEDSDPKFAEFRTIAELFKRLVLAANRNLSGSQLFKNASMKVEEPVQEMEEGVQFDDEEDEDMSLNARFERRAGISFGNAVVLACLVFIAVSYYLGPSLTPPPLESGIIGAEGVSEARERVHVDQAKAFRRDAREEEWAARRERNVTKMLVHAEAEHLKGHRREAYWEEQEALQLDHNTSKQLGRKEYDIKEDLHEQVAEDEKEVARLEKEDLQEDKERWKAKSQEPGREQLLQRSTLVLQNWGAGRSNGGVAQIACLALASLAVATAWGLSTVCCRRRPRRLRSQSSCGALTGASEPLLGV